jgi:hypothetical protein
MGRPGGKASPKAVNQQSNESRALQLRMSGATYEQIGALMGLGTSTVYEMVKRALATANAEIRQNAAHHRELEARRLDQMMVSLWGSAVTKGPDQYGAVEKVLRIMERRAKLLCLDALPDDPEVLALKRERMMAEIRLLQARAASATEDPLSSATDAELTALLESVRKARGPNGTGSQDLARTEAQGAGQGIPDSPGSGDD